MVKKKGLFLIAALFSMLTAVFIPSIAMAYSWGPAETDSAITNIIMSVSKTPTSGTTVPQTGDNLLWIIGTIIAALLAITFFGVYLKTRHIQNQNIFRAKVIPVGIVALIGIILTMIVIGTGIVKANAASEQPVIEPVADHIQIITAEDGSEYHYGDAPYSNIQNFTNTSAEYTLALSKISLISTDKLDNIGTWRCTLTTPEGKDYEVFNGGLGSVYEITDEYSLSPGESYTLTWSTSLTAKELKSFGDVTPAFIQYDYVKLPNEFVGVVTEIDYSNQKYSNMCEVIDVKSPDYIIEFYYDAKDHQTNNNFVGKLPHHATSREDWFYHTPKNGSGGYLSNYILGAIVDDSVRNIPDLTSTIEMFSFPRCAYLEGINNVNMSNVVDASWMFAGCSSDVIGEAIHGSKTPEERKAMMETLYAMNNLDLSQFDTHNVKNMQGMFAGDTRFMAINTCNEAWTNLNRHIGLYKPVIYAPIVSNFDTSNVEDMSYMFMGLPVTVNAPAVDNWDTSGVLTMQDMFGYYGYLPVVMDIIDPITPKYIPAPNMLAWNVSNVKNMNQMFYNYGGALLTDINGGKFDGIEFNFSTWHTKNVKDCYQMLSLPYLYVVKIGTGWELNFKEVFGSEMYSWWMDKDTEIKYSPAQYGDMPIMANKTYIHTPGSPDSQGSSVADNIPATEEIFDVNSTITELETPTVQNAPTVAETPAAEEMSAPVVEEPVTQE